MPAGKSKAVRLRPKQSLKAPREHRLAVFTALEGALLDSRTYEPGPTRELVRRLVSSGVPVIPMSVMTLDEVAPVAEELGLRQAMVVEAGGAIARWVDGRWNVEPCGPPAAEFLDVVLQIETLSGADLLVYSALPMSEAAELSGRSGEMLDASMRRDFSEPFVIDSGDLVSVKRAAASIGFSVRRGRHFLHLCRECDEGETFTRLRDELRCKLTIAIGGTGVDAEFLSQADIPIIVPGSDGEVDSELAARLPHARIAPAPGPEGWSIAVEEVWQSLDRPMRRVRRA